MRRILLTAALFTAMVGLSQVAAQPNPELFKVMRPAMQVLSNSARASGEAMTKLVTCGRT